MRARNYLFNGINIKKIDENLILNKNADLRNGLIEKFIIIFVFVIIDFGLIDEVGKPAERNLVWI